MGFCGYDEFDLVPTMGLIWVPLIDCTIDFVEEAIASQLELGSGSIFIRMCLADASACYGQELVLSTGNAYITSSSSCSLGQGKFGKS